jgi:hypothetical protein
MTSGDAQSGRGQGLLCAREASAAQWRRCGRCLPERKPDAEDFDTPQAAMMSDSGAVAIASRMRSHSAASTGSPSPAHAVCSARAWAMARPRRRRTSRACPGWWSQRGTADVAGAGQQCAAVDAGGDERCCARGIGAPSCCCRPTSLGTPLGSGGFASLDLGRSRSGLACDQRRARMKNSTAP